MPLPAALLNRSATVYRSMGEVRLPAGGARRTKPTIVGTAAIRITPAGAREATIGGIRGALVTHKVYAAAGADIRRGDELEILTPVRMLLSVVDIERPSIPDHHMTALAYEVQRV
jgi:hypothetical protein